MNENIGKLEGGESLNHFHKRKTFKLIGLNKPWKAGGFNSIYATIRYGNNDWFHCKFDDKLFPYEKLNEIFDLFKNSKANIWHQRNHKVILMFDGYSHTGRPINPIIKELLLATE